MRKAKRGGDDTRSVRIRMTEQVSGRFVMDSTQDAWAELSDGQQSYLSKSVASIALCKGDTILFSCSGIAMERQFSTTRFLTSATLGEELYRRNEHRNELKIEVRHEGNTVYGGRMDEYDLDRNFSVVSVPGYLDVSVGPFQRALEFLPLGEVFVSVGRGVSGKIMAKSLELNGEDDEDVDCHKIDEAWQGGPVLFADHVVGMNLYLTTTRAIFKPWGTIFEHLEHCWTSQQMSKVFRFGARPMGEKSITYPHTVQGHYFRKDLLHLDSDGYPKLPSTMLRSGMMLVNTFEETFGDKLDQHNKGVWSKLSKKASGIDRNVVALASFKGEERFFACSGFFIEQNECATILTSASLLRGSSDENSIAENLRIEVLLGGKLFEGTLLDYNLHCNVALVSVKGCHVRRPLNTVAARNYFDVAAVGRIFKTDELIATSGEMVGWTGTLDCIVLRRSTCKSCKAAIGGPLVNLDGDVVGMNFYDMRIGTPYLPWVDILTILSWFRTKSKPGEAGYITPYGAPFCEVVGDENAVLNRWPVPMPHWRHPDFVEGDNSDDEFVSESESGRKRELITYSAGVKYMLTWLAKVL